TRSSHRTARRPPNWYGILTRRSGAAARDLTPGPFPRREGAGGLVAALSTAAAFPIEQNACSPYNPAVIPRSLRLRNFLCYGDTLEPINLEAIHVACLTGDNGHGKTALVDALTWALWGRSRAKSDDDLIHLGQT